MGKTTMAVMVNHFCVKKVLIESHAGVFTCLEIDSASHLDLIEIDAASRTKVEDTVNLMDNVHIYLHHQDINILDEVYASTKSLTRF